MMSPGLTLTTCAPSPEPEFILYKRTELVLSLVDLGVVRINCFDPRFFNIVI